MPEAAPRDVIYRRSRFPTDVIEQCVRWYVTYRLSYRDLVAIMAEQGVVVSHTTIMRWVVRFVPEYERRWSRFSRPTGRSWRMDETVIFVGGYQHWLYRAVDRHGKSIHSRLSNTRTIAAAKAFFQSAVSEGEAPWPTTVNLDGNQATHQGLRGLGKKDPRWASIKVRANRYLNNVIEQDHRAIKSRCSAVLGFKSFSSAAITLAGFELAHRVRKHQYAVPRSQDQEHGSLKSLWQSALNETNDQKSRAPSALPSMHQISADPGHYRRQRPRRRYSRRHPLRVPYGQGLYLLVMPSGGRFWRYRYQFRGKKGTLALGEYPIVPLERAKVRHAAARQLVEEGIDPATKRRELRYLKS